MTSLGWTSPGILALAAVAIITLGWFVRHELVAADPILDLRLFKNRNFFLTNLLLSLVFFSFAGINYLLPFYLKYVRDYDTSSAGLIMTSLSFAMMGSGVLSGMLYNRAGPRALCVASGISLTAGYFLMTRLHMDTQPGFIVVALVLIGFGLGLDDHPGLEHGDELGVPDKTGDGLEPHRSRAVRPADARHRVLQPDLPPGRYHHCRKPQRHETLPGRYADAGALVRVRPSRSSSRSCSGSLSSQSPSSPGKRSTRTMQIRRSR